MKTALRIEKKSKVISKIQENIYTGRGHAHGTFGEFLQGVLPGDRHFLVTSPIGLYSYAEFKSCPELAICAIHPIHKEKSLILANRMLRYFDKPEGGNIIIKSFLPEGQGLASSSADLVATARAIIDCFNLNCPNELVEKFIAQIEPSEGVMYDGVVAYYHREVRLKEQIGYIPPLVIVAVDEGGHIDTVEYNKIPRFFSDENKEEYEILLKEIRNAILNQDLFTLGKISTHSAILNQKFNHKKLLPFLYKISCNLNCLGVIVAHSGSFLGILLNANDPCIQRKIDHIFREIKRKGYYPILLNSMVFTGYNDGENMDAI